MDFGKAFSYVFEDEGWITKLLIGGLILLIPIVGALTVLGWALEIGRRVASGQESDILPDWSDFGTYLVRGLKAFVVMFVYALPIIILEICPITLTAMAQGMESQSMASIAQIINLLVSCVVFVYEIFLLIIAPAALMRFTMQGDDIKAGLAFGEIFSQVKANLGVYVMVALGQILAYFIGGLGIIACGIGLLFTVPYAYAVVGHFYGQAYREVEGGNIVDATPAPAAGGDWTA
ncbi:MAG: DUF4013 domain-containing protein [Chloroflexi bacterium]|nr:DUF4013 domain-containing protein [Chloroflexota bacterium]